jgi:hypothetical protein
MADLVVQDNDWSGANDSMDKQLRNYCDFLSKTVANYIQIIDAFAGAGKTTESVAALKSSIMGLDSKLSEMGRKLETDAKNFVSQIDDADSFLYN